jgi:hypothetical protein
MVELYRNNPKLKAKGAQTAYTQEQSIEMVKCASDPEYFFSHYVHIINADGKDVLFKPRDYQERFLDLMCSSRFVIGCLPRQVGKSVIVAAYLLHAAVFNKNYSVLIAANKASSAKNIMKKIKIMYENLPLWMQHGIVAWNVQDISFDNGSSIKAEATSEDSGRSGTYQCILLDEFAFVENNVAEEFYKSVYPTIAGGTDTKIFIISTPNGMNRFHKMWTEAKSNVSRFKPIEIKWDDPPGRDERYRDETISNVGQAAWDQEYDCKFLGSVNSLISAQTLERIPFVPPIEIIDDSLKIFEKPKFGHSYFMTVDVSMGKGLDNSAFVVFDITGHPYRTVATFKHDEIDPSLLPNELWHIAKSYNNALVLIEYNAGQIVGDTMYYEMEYENLLWSTVENRVGQVLGHGGQVPGVIMSRAVKRIGCFGMKSLIEGDQLIILDYDIVEELNNFVRHKTSYAATPGNHDDMVMCCVLFAWAVNQPYFKELTDTDIRSTLFAKQMKQIEDDLIPFGKIDDGLEPEYQTGGWQHAKNTGKY